MELDSNELQAPRQRVDQSSSELDKQNTVRVVNTKWMVIVGAVILSALGFTSFVQLPIGISLRTHTVCAHTDVSTPTLKSTSTTARAHDSAGGLYMAEAWAR